MLPLDACGRGRHDSSVEASRPFHIGHSQRPTPYPGGLTPLGMNAGLCDTCKHQKVVRNTRGSVFSMCERSKTDERYPKYPRLPVERCPGYVRATR
jgi:hypothetical protein